MYGVVCGYNEDFSDFPKDFTTVELSKSPGNAKYHLPILSSLPDEDTLYVI